MKSRHTVRRRRHTVSRSSAFTHLFKVFYLLGQLLLVNLTIVISFGLVAASRSIEFELSFQDYRSTVPLLMLFAVVYIDYLGMTQFLRKNYADMFSSSIIFSFLTILTTSTIAFFFRWFLLSRYVLVLAFFILIVLTFLWSSVCLKVSKLIYRRGKLLIIATTREEADRLFSKVQYELSGRHMDYIGYTTSKRRRYLFTLIDQSTEVMVSPKVNEALKSHLLLYCADKDKTIYVVPHFSDLVFTKFRVLQFYDMPTFMIDSLGLTYQQRLFKRIFDILFSLAVVLTTLPLQLVLIILITLESPGPAVFAQERTTLDGRVYKVLKFRTMVDDAERRYGDHLSQKDDPRVTKLGRFLRNTRIDELLQFYNILTGDMSVVGPRPERPALLDAIEQEVPGFTQRLKVKSGLTGLAQVYGKYDTKPEDKLRFDIMYIRNYTFLMDLRIIAATIRAMLPFNIYSQKVDTANFEVVPAGEEQVDGS